MPQKSGQQSSKRVLEPIERVSEVLFGLIMVLTFTGTLSAAESGQSEVRTMLFGALGCNLAWGLIDAIMYLMASLSERARVHRTVLAVRNAATPAGAHSAISDALPPIVAATLNAGEFEKIRNALNGLPELPKRPRLYAEDWQGAVGVFLLVFLSTFPVVLPFIFMHDAMIALRISNLIAISMLFGTGYAFGRLAGYQPLLVAGAMVVLGCLLVAITIALGG
jgi:VIT1/CCC1 family predicted Fe2+/Mn2+ transporter